MGIVDLNEDQPEQKEVKATYSEFGTARKSVLITCILAELYGRQSTFLSSSLTLKIKDQEKNRQEKNNLLPRMYADLPRW